jgi:predicted unusual protein kinase regulating ubiquinone biosynthesis (AarF/ABC1/UbiB family)
MNNVRLLQSFIVFLLVTDCRASAETQYYLNPSEKAIVALALKSIQTPLTEQAELIQKVLNNIKKSEEKVQTRIKVSSYKELIEAQKKADLFDSYSSSQIETDKLLGQIKNVQFYSDSPTVQKKIDQYFQKRTEILRNSSLYISLLGFDIALRSRSSKQDLKEFTTDYIEQKVNLMIQKLNQNENPQTLIISKLLKAYYAHLPQSQKIEIIYQLLKIPINSNSMDVFLVMIQNSGPQIQKLIQIMGRSSNIPVEFQDLFQKLESQVKPIPWREVQSLIESEGLKISDFIYLQHEALGVGTMAQTHRAQMIDDQGIRQNLVIRFLKPGIAELLKMDYDILKIIAQDIDVDPDLKKYSLPSLADLVEDLNLSVVEELNLERTIHDQNRSQKIYTHIELISFNKQKNYLQFNVPKTYSLGKNKKLMVQELVFGQKPSKELAQYKELYPDLYKVVAEKTAELWLSETFFKSGFFHADLHQGNLMLHLTDPVIKLHILDFGMTGKLNQKQRDSAILLGLGIKLNHAELILKHLTQLTKSQSISADFKDKLLKQVRQIKTKEIPTQSLSSWITWALDQGADLNYEFLKLNRGLTAIEVLLTDAKSPLSFVDILQTLTLKNKIYISDLILKEKDLKLKDLPEMISVLKQMKIEKPLVVCKKLF